MEQLNLRELNKQLARGILPNELNFTVQPQAELDLNKIKYNAFYRTYEYAETKFPKGHENIPGFGDVIQLFADDLGQTTPLEEILTRRHLPLAKVNSNTE